MVLITLEYQYNILVAPYMLSMFHNSGVVINFRGELVLESKHFSTNDNEISVGGLN